MKADFFRQKEHGWEIAGVFLPAIVILAIHAVLGALGLYSQIEWIDIPMHFFGGVLLGFSLHSFMAWAQHKNHLPRIGALWQFVFTLGLLALFVVTWEFSEFALDRIDTAGMRQTGLFDTMKDMFLGLIGGILGYFLQHPLLRKD